MIGYNLVIVYACALRLMKGFRIMRLHKILRWLLLLCFMPVLAVASTLNTQCLMLGSHPSLIIKFKGISSQAAPTLKSDLLSGLISDKAKFTIAKPLLGGSYVVYFTPSKSMQSDQIKPGCYSPQLINSLIEELKAKGNIEYADPNILMSVMEKKSHTRTPIIDPVQWDLLNPPGGMNLQLVFDTGFLGNSTVTTAVLDTGILNNASLNPNVLSGVTFSNGHSGQGATPSCNSNCEGYDHGTHVAGTVASTGNGAYGQSIYGVAPITKILPVNVFTIFTTTQDCGGTAPCLLSATSDQINALNWLAGDKVTGLPTAPPIAMVNMSLGGVSSCSTAMQTAINRLYTKNIAFSIAAGNNNVDAKTFTPANCKNVMAVAAVGPAGYGAFYSNYGTTVSYAAPGGDNTNGIADQIYSTIEDGYDYKQGTSMAAPHAAGLGALMYSIDPTITPSTVLSIMKSTANPFPTGGPGYACTIGRPCGAGIIDAYAAVNATYAQAPQIVWPSSPITFTENSATKATITWKAAVWQPTRTTTILYTVNLDGSDVPSCTLQTTRSCVLTGLLPDSSHVVYITATDAKQFITPVPTAPLNFQMILIPPTLTTAVRNPLVYRQVFVNYSSLGGPTPNHYQLNGAPAGVTLTLDTAHQRFIMDNVVTLAQIDNVSISSIYNPGPVIRTSNTVTIPGVTPTPPVLSFAVRNPLQLTEVFVYYTAVGGPPPDQYVVYNVPAGTTIMLDTSQQRFILDNITSPKQIDEVVIAGMYGSVVSESNAVTIPSILN